MARVSPAPADRVAEFVADFDKSKKQRGYVPNSWLTLVRKPRVFKAFRELRETVMSDTTRSPRSLRSIRSSSRASTLRRLAGLRACMPGNSAGMDLPLKALAGLVQETVK